jgi:hypothetical protein
MWKTAVAEIFRILAPGGWVELVESDVNWAVGPQSTKVETIVHALFQEKGLLVDLEVQIPGFLGEAGFTDIHSESQGMSLGRAAGGDGFEGTENVYHVAVGMKAQ